MNLETMRLLVAKGLSAEDILEIAETMASAPEKRSSGAERQARYRARKAQANDACDVTSDVTRDGDSDATEVTEPSLSLLPNENNSNPSTHTHPDRDTPPAREDGEPAEPATGKAPKGKPVVPDWIPAKPWNGYLEMRRRIGKPPTDRAIELMIGKLERWRAEGHDPGAILDDATERNWTGLYPPKEPRNGTYRAQDLPSGNGRGSDRRTAFDRAIDEGFARLGG